MAADLTVILGNGMRGASNINETELKSFTSTSNLTNVWICIGVSVLEDNYVKLGYWYYNHDTSDANAPPVVTQLLNSEVADPNYHFGDSPNIPALHFKKNTNYVTFEPVSMQYRNFWLVNNVVDLGQAMLILSSKSKTIGVYYLIDWLQYGLGSSEIKNQVEDTGIAIPSMQQIKPGAGSVEIAWNSFIGYVDLSTSDDYLEIPGFDFPIGTDMTNNDIWTFSVQLDFYFTDPTNRCVGAMAAMNSCDESLSCDFYVDNACRLMMIQIDLRQGGPTYDLIFLLNTEGG